jgi:hypothetical protein
LVKKKKKSKHYLSGTEPENFMGGGGPGKKKIGFLEFFLLKKNYFC